MTTELQQWRSNAACLEGDPDLFFPILTTGPSYEQGLQIARDICERCGVFDQCLHYALSENVDEGIWAGTTPMQRKRLNALKRQS